MPARPRLFLGHVMHRRTRPQVNAFVYPVFYVQLPLHDLAAARRPLFSLERFNWLSFHNRDHGPRDGSPLLPWIRQRLREQGLADDGEIVLQCFPRVLGYVFNPVSFWLCHNSSGQLIAVLAEVSNTFGGRHSYLLHQDGQPLADGMELRTTKAFHVSPFCDVEGGYRFRFHLQRNCPVVRIDYDDADGEVLLTSISGRPKNWSTAALFAAVARMPLLTAGVIWRIHWQALKLWLKGVPFVGARPSAHSPSFQESTK